MTEFACGSGQCIDHAKVCDGRKDCYDGSDENSTNCGKFTAVFVVIVQLSRGEYQDVYHGRVSECNTND